MDLDLNNFGFNNEKTNDPIEIWAKVLSRHLTKNERPINVGRNI